MTWNLGEVQWNSDSNFPVNRSLLNISKVLMRNVYDLSQNGESFLPESFEENPFTHKLTRYSYHWKNKTHIFFLDKNFLWDCNRGIVQSVSKDCENPWKKMILTDCSGFIWGLFSFVNTFDMENIGRPTNFNLWKVGKKVPLVGVPITDKQYFHDVQFDNLSPGDLVGWSLFFTKASDGHIMLVAAVEEGNSSEKFVSIISVGTTHHRDTRLENLKFADRISGLGCGYAMIKKTEEDENGFTGFKIRKSSKNFLRSKIVRALNTPQTLLLKRKESEAYLGIINGNQLTYRYYITHESGKFTMPVFSRWVVVFKISEEEEEDAKNTLRRKLEISFETKRISLEGGDHAMDISPELFSSKEVLMGEILKLLV